MPDGLVVRLSGEDRELLQTFSKADAQIVAFTNKIDAQLKKIDRTIADTGKSGFSKFQANIVTLNQGLQLLGSIGASAFSIFDRTIGAAINRGEDLNKLSQSVGVSVEELSSLSLAAEQADVDLNSLGQGLKFLNLNTIEAQKGTSEAGRAYKALGIDIRDANGELRPAEELLLAVADAFAATEDGAAKTKIAIALLGKTGADLIPFLNQGSAAIRRQQQLAEKLGLTYTTEAAQGAEEFNDTLALVGKTVEGISTEIAQELLPDLIAGAAAMSDWAQANSDWIATNVVDGIREFRAVLDEARGVLDLLPDLTFDWVGMLRSTKAELAAIGVVWEKVRPAVELLLKMRGGAAGIGAGEDWEAGVGQLPRGYSDATKLIDESSLQLARRTSQVDQGITVLRTNFQGLAVEVRDTAKGTLQWGEESDRAGKKAENAAKQARESIADILSGLQLDARTTGLPEVERQVLEVTARIEELGKGKLPGPEIAANIGIATTAVRELAAATGTVKIEEVLKDLETERVNAGLSELDQRILDITERIQEFGRQGGVAPGVVADAVAQATSDIRSISQQPGLKEVEETLKSLQREVDDFGLDEFDRQIIDVTRHFEDLATQQKITWDAARTGIASATTLIEAQRRQVDELRNAFLTTNQARDIGRDLFSAGRRGRFNGVLDELSDVADEASEKFWDQMIFGKEEHFDRPLVRNISSLFLGNDGGIVGAIAKRGGIFAGQMFNDSFQGGVEIGRTGALSSPADLPIGDVTEWEVIGQDSGSGFSAGVQKGMEGLSAGLAGFNMADSLISNFEFSQSQQAQLGGKIAGGVGGAIGFAFGGPAGAAAGSFLGEITGSLLGSLFAPQRIEKEKQQLEEILEGILDVNIPVRRINEFRREAEANFDAVEGSLSAVGVTAALALKEGGIGSVKRFGNLAQAGFEQAGLSAKEAQKEVLALAAATDFTLTKAIRDLNDATSGGFPSDENQLSLREYREEIREGQDDIVTMGSVLTGTLEIFSGFSPVVNESALAARFLSEEFVQTATATGLMNSQVAALGAQVRAGMIPIEEAIIQLNQLRREAGLSALELSDFHLDSFTLTEEVQRVVEVANNLGRTAGDEFAGGFEEGLLRIDFEKSLEEQLEGVLRGGLVQQILRQNQDQLFAGLDFTDLTSITSADIQTVTTRFGALYETTRQILDAAGLLPEILEETDDVASDLEDTLGRIADDFRGTAKDIQSTIDSLVFGKDSPFSDTEQLGLLKEREQAMRASLSSLAPDALPGALEDLANVMAKQSPLLAEVLGASSDEFGDRFDALLAGLENVRGQATSAAATIDQQLLDANLRQEGLLIQIRDTIGEALGVEIRGATGGQWLVNGPTRGLFGEREPELLMALPLSKMRTRMPDMGEYATSRGGSISLVLPPGLVVIHGDASRPQIQRAARDAEEYLLAAIESPRVRRALREATQPY